MQFINYFFASLISYSGFLIGMLLARIAPEEQKPLEKHLIFLRKLLLSAIFVFLMFYFFNNPANLVIPIIYVVFLFFIEYRINDLLKKSIIIYQLLGIIFFLSSKNANLFAIESSLIFLYGLPTSSLLCNQYNKREKNRYKLIFYNSGFVIIAILLFFV